MSTSGSKDYSITRSDIIEGAYRKTGLYDAGDPLSGEDTEAGAFSLNLMVKEWVARGIDIWLRDEITLFLQPGTREYAMGTANATASFVETTLSAAEASGQTVISVTSSTGMTAADFVGIKQSDDTIHWTTIVTVDSSTQITITTATTVSSDSGAAVYAYTTKAGRPQKLIHVYRRDINGFDTEVDIIGEQEYRRQSNKGSEGPPVEVWYQPTLTTGSLYVWPVDGGVNWDKLVISAQFLPDDFDASSDNPEFPIEWGNALVWNLAAELAPELGLPRTDVMDLRRQAEFKLGELLDYDQENASLELGLEYMR